jgi:hypothetical protein
MTTTQPTTTESTMPAARVAARPREIAHSGKLHIIDNFFHELRRHG